MEKKEEEQQNNKKKKKVTITITWQIKKNEEEVEGFLLFILNHEMKSLCCTDRAEII